jgi:hypothetical protein
MDNAEMDIMSDNAVKTEKIKNTIQLHQNTTQNSSEKFIYHFDYPNLIESGYVNILENKIIILFPEKKFDNVQQKECYLSYQDVLLFINKQLKFSYSWLPIYTINDFYRIKDMLCKCLIEFRKNTNLIHNFENYYYPKYYNEVVTEIKNDFFQINCFENKWTTTIEIDFQNNENKKFKLDDTLPILEIYIGKNLVFSSNDYNCLCKTDVFFLLDFILHKMLKY